MESSRNSYAAGLGLIAAGAVCWSTAGVAVRWVDASAWEVMFWRSVFLMAAMLPILLPRRAKVLSDCRSTGWPMVMSGALLAGCFIFFILALSHTTVANTLFVMACAPLLAAAVGWVFFGEHVRPYTWLAIMVAGLGIVLMVWNSLQSGDLLGAAFAFTVALCFSINANLVRHYRKVSMLPGVLLAGILSASIAAPLALSSLPSAGELAVFAFLGIIQLGLGLVLFTIGARSVPAAQAVIVGLLEIVLGPVWVWLAYSERPTAMALIGGSVVIAAVAFNGIAGMRRRRLTSRS